MSQWQTIRKLRVRRMVGRAMAGREVRTSIFHSIPDCPQSVECVFCSAASCYLHMSLAIFAFVRFADLPRRGHTALEMKEAQTNLRTQD